MSIPDFERAEYHEPAVIDGATGFVEASPRLSVTTFPLSLLYGALAAVAGAAVYAAISMTGFMVSIVAIGIGYVVAKAMMTASRGIGGQRYQIAAVALTYFSCTFGSLAGAFLREHVSVFAMLLPANLPLVVRYVVFGPFLRFLDNPFWAVMGLLILFYGLRTAWQMAAGVPGFGQPGGPRMTIGGLRR